MMDEHEITLRAELADAFRICHALGWSESVGNHFSAALDPDGKVFLLNPRWQHFATISPEDLLALNSGDPSVMTRDNAPDASAWCIHGTIHRRLPSARVVLHVHSPYATALACLKDPTLWPIDNNTARFFGRVAYDLHFGGIADALEEGVRIAGALSDKSVLVMGNTASLSRDLPLPMRLRIFIFSSVRPRPSCWPMQLDGPWRCWRIKLPRTPQRVGWPIVVWQHATLTTCGLLMG